MLSVALAKMIKTALNKTGREGSTLPGKVSVKLFNNSLTKASEYCDKVILVSGTNGKTTMTRIISEVLSVEHSVITNSSGANLLSGVASTFLVNQDVFGKKRYDYAVLEVDESALGDVAKRVKPDYILMNNLTMDQVDRHSSVFSLADKINAELYDLESTVIINVNDPYVAYATDRLKQIRVKTNYVNSNNDDKKVFLRCMDCDKKTLCATNITMMIDGGKGGMKSEYHCTSCGFDSSSNLIDSSITWKEDVELLTFIVAGNLIQTKFKGEYHKENFELLIKLFEELNINVKTIKRVLESNIQINGRDEVFIIQDVKHTLNLTKNPASFNTYLKSREGDNIETLFLAFGNEIADGRSKEWIKHLEFESVRNFKGLKYIIIVGSLSSEIELIFNDLKLKSYEGDHISIGSIREDEFKDYIKNSIKSGINKDEALFISNYSKLGMIRRTLKELEELK